jgi:hypothetical protein
MEKVLWTYIRILKNTSKADYEQVKDSHVYYLG